MKLIVAKGVEGKRVAVLGLGRSGIACCQSLGKGGAEVFVWDDDPTQLKNASQYQLKRLDPKDPDCMKNIDLLIISPGIPHLYPEPHPIIRNGLDAGIAIDNEIGLFFNSLNENCSSGQNPTVIGVTGSNGKSTTSSLIHHLLNSAGYNSCLAGNIGFPALSIDLRNPDTIIVLEISSYQCDVASALEPNIAVFLNYSQDHIDRHGGIGGYLAAKQSLFSGKRLEKAIVSTGQIEGKFISGKIIARIGQDNVIRISSCSSRPGLSRTIMYTDSSITEYHNGQETVSFDLSKQKHLLGQHNMENASAAYAVCRYIGLENHDIRAGFVTYSGLPHRCQFVGKFDGVSVINDSKATNAGSTANALRTYKNIRWIAGGKAKEGGIAGLVDQLSNVKAAYLIGESADLFAIQLKTLPSKLCSTMENAVKIASSESVEGDTILLSPAAASFDQYNDFEERGRDFLEQVAVVFGQNTT